MLEVNEFLVLDYVRDHDPTSRTDIARDLGLSAASVGRIIGRLRQDGLVDDVGASRSNGGRPRAMISYRRDAGSVIAVDLGGTRCHSALADLSGAVLAEDVRPTHSTGDAFTTLLRAIELMLQEAGRRRVPVVALAVGVPGILDPQDGVARESRPVPGRWSAMASGPAWLTWRSPPRRSWPPRSQAIPSDGRSSTSCSMTWRWPSWPSRPPLIRSS